MGGQPLLQRVEIQREVLDAGLAELDAAVPDTRGDHR